MARQIGHVTQWSAQRTNAVCSGVSATPALTIS
jgi:hypothetical protein